MKASPVTGRSPGPIVFEMPDQPEMVELYGADADLQWNLAQRLLVADDPWERTVPMGLDVLL